MRPSDLPAAILRRWFLFAGTFVLCLGAVVAVTLLLPKTYEASATMYIGGRESTSPDELVRTYAALAGNPNIAEAVRRELPFRLGRGALLDRMSFAPVPRTQLLEVTAAASTPARARLLANTYASVFAARMADQYAANKIQEAVSVSEVAALPSSPARPDPPVYIGLGALLSLLLAAGAVALREALTPRPYIRAYDARAFDLPVLGRVPSIERDEPDATAEVEDAFQWLATSFDASAGRRPAVVAVVSPSPGDGKSTIVANLAVTFARDGETVVVVEADLRRPTLDATVLGEGLERSDTGLSDHLEEESPYSDLLVPNRDLPGLYVMWSGKPSGHPGRLLRSPRFGVLLGALGAEFDRVIVDTPPIAVGPDAALVAAASEAAVFVVDLRRTTLPAVRVGLDRLKVTGASVLGVVLNNAPIGFDGYYAAAAPASEATAEDAQRA
jgi:capsular exopolysaccharide synthesis family protein